ncbi:hypothetical protein PG994_012489 [Apiospora phragmitis]|uniref:Uncharacterized protein n=1 Tax=Apiospora phragmitis TaxID=2905665 RepID=A0ABR1TVS6_9PEZI
MAGYPSAQQIAEIGAVYRVDPDFFDAHLSFMFDDIANLSSVGSFMKGSGQLNWQSRRQQFTEEMGSYVHSLRMGR